MSEKDKKYKIVFSNNKEFIVDQKYLDYLPKLKDTLSEEKEYDIIYNNIEGHIFQYLLTFINYTSEHPNDKLFVKNFIKNMDANTLFDVIYASNYFGVKQLLKFTSEYFKTIISEKDVDEIKKFYNL